jgi:hypothetical protein
MLYRFDISGNQEGKSKEIFYMNTNIDDDGAAALINLLKEKRDWYEKQIRILDKMLKAVEGDINESPTQKIIASDNIPWSKLIDEIFKTHDNLTLKQVQEKIAEMGYPQAKEKKRKATVYQTLIRKVKNGDLSKAGSYYLPKNIEKE